MTSCEFAINGRFLSQPVTGVQRYARNVVAAMSAPLSDLGASAPILVPSSGIDFGLTTMPVTEIGPLTGHAWEQSTLPLRWRGRLLNLGNTAPALKADQVVCIHDANVFVAPESYAPTFRLTYTTVQNLVARRSARLATVSSDSARQIARYLPVRAADIAVLPNGHEHALAWDPALAQIGREAVNDIAKRSGRRFVLALGSRARHKNMQLVFDIAPALAELGLDVIIAGGGDGIYAAEMLRTESNVKTLGYVTDHDLAYLMSHAVCLVFPSWTEGFGLPIVEAMARGCPVISSDRASMPEVCGSAALMAPPDDPASWVRHLAALAQSAELRHELVGRGHEQVLRFSWSQTAAGYVELMRDPKRRYLGQKGGDQRMLNIAVVTATVGRPDIVTQTLTHLLTTQSLKPSSVLISCANVTDAGESALYPTVKVVTGPLGLATQRNTALAAVPDGTDIVVFFDDDFVADAGWLAAAERSFRDEPDVVGFTGYVIRDGIKGPGLSFAEAVDSLHAGERSPSWTQVEPFSPYGCNMAFRMAAIGDLKFDPRLVLYGWLEDRDFGAALAKRGGRLIKCPAAWGVHMGVKSGRVAGERLGYSQVVNPIYMLRKGTISLRQVASHIFGNVASNVALSFKPEAFIDRRGRLRGNILGVLDMLRGRLEPERAAAINRTGKSG